MVGGRGARIFSMQGETDLLISRTPGRGATVNPKLHLCPRRLPGTRPEDSGCWRQAKGFRV